MSVPIELEVKDKVALLTLAVPPVNALDENALRSLMESLDEIERSGNIRALVIAGGIEDIFCTGGNLKYWPRVHPNAAEIVGRAGRKVFRRIENLSKPSIAAVDGCVIGDGISLALACDIRIASPSSSFSLPELDYGFIPGWGTIGRLIHVIGRPLAAEMLLFGQKIAAKRALAIRLINRIAPAEELIPQALDLAKQAAEKPPNAMFHAKAALRGSLMKQDKEEEDWEMTCFKSVWGSREWQIGIEKLFRRDGQ